ncbi:hypothetical protein NDU88_000347 [Pleurodeles waltl]|uniref:DUF4685 domain-containing protein n=1 Tax=Pleurodeles waltl TaxID=8319 RepID=A0AAV7Q0Z0_PLEWA|nr:hypothetical protein NDU88_000347 [Pleurodeles waltl]
MLLENASANREKSLEGFYEELRRKYPNTFSRAPGLGTGKSATSRLPQLEGPVGSVSSAALLASASQTVANNRWTQDGFLSKVHFQKAQSGHVQGMGPVQHYAGPLIIKDSVIVVPSWNAQQSGSGYGVSSVRLPNLRTQVERNQEALLSRRYQQKQEVEQPVGSQVKNKRPIHTNDHGQNPETRTSSGGPSMHNCSDSQERNSGERPRTSAESPDPLGTIMKELLPNKPGRLMKEPQNETKELTRRKGNPQAESGRTPGLSMLYTPSPAKMFRPKMQTPQGPPKPSDIIKRFSTKPTASCGPLKADHSLGKRLQMQVLESVESVTVYSESTVTTTRGKQEGKAVRQTTPTRVRFTDESFRAAESRYRERAQLGKRDAEDTSPMTPLVSESQLRLQGRPTEGATTQRPPSSPAWRTQQRGQFTCLEPPKPAAFSPTVARKAMNTPPRHHPIRPSHAQEDQHGVSMGGPHLSPRYGGDATSLDSISMNFSINSWENAGEMHSKGGSGLGDHVKTVKEVSELSYLYSKVKKTFHTQLQRLPNPGTVGFSKGSEDTGRSATHRQHLYEWKPDSTIEKPTQEGGLGTPDAPVRNMKTVPAQDYATGLGKAPLSHEHSLNWNGISGGHQNVPGHGLALGRMPSPPDTKQGPLSRMLAMPMFMKKGRAKNYLVRVPTPPPLDHRRPADEHAARRAPAADPDGATSARNCRKHQGGGQTSTCAFTRAGIPE